MDRITVDREWEYEELYDEVDNECIKYYKDNNISQRYENKAVYDKDLLKPMYMAEHIKNMVLEQDKDLVQVYNEQYNKRKGEKLFGIVYFDQWLINIIKQELKKNEVK